MAQCAALIAPYLGPGIEAAIKGYADEVRSRAFPGPDHVYGMMKKG